MKRTRLVAIAIVLGALAPALALAQKFDPKRAASFVVGPPPAPLPMERFDAHRSGVSPAALPSGDLQFRWHHSLGEPALHAPLVVGKEVVIVAGRGDVAFLDAGDGSDVAKVTTGSDVCGPPVALANGTIVVVARSSGMAIGVTKTGVVFRTKIGGDPPHEDLSPLPMADGGVVVGRGSELTLLDSAGGIRARGVFPEAIEGSLLASRGRVLAVAETGVVYAWTPGHDVERVGNFGARAVGGATLDGDDTLLAVTEGARIMSLDLVKGVAAPRASSTGFLFVGPVAMRGTSALVLAKGVRGAFLLGFDRAGDVTQTPIAASPLPVLADGGVGTPTVGGHAPLVVDKSGNVAFSVEDDVGVAVLGGGANETVAHLSGALCKTHGADVLGIAPVADASSPGFVLACEDGAVALVGKRH
ncbi:MAG TPA: PQQ-binding-like beta-propeller repeat protein [Polyangiaceae bacterium]